MGHSSKRFDGMSAILVAEADVAFGLNDDITFDLVNSVVDGVTFNANTFTLPQSDRPWILEYQFLSTVFTGVAEAVLTIVDGTTFAQEPNCGRFRLVNLAAVTNVNAPSPSRGIIDTSAGPRTLRIRAIINAGTLAITADTSLILIKQV